jgi:hypothetical protein
LRAIAPSWTRRDHADPGAPDLIAIESLPAATIEAARTNDFAKDLREGVPRRLPRAHARRRHRPAHRPALNRIAPARHRSEMAVELTTTRLERSDVI